MRTLGALLSLLALPSAAATLRYAEDRAPAIVNPLFATSMSEARVDELVFEGLFADDLELRSEGRLAESFELAPDQRSMKIRLRREAVWHDGREVTADDVVFSIEAYRSAITASTESGRVAWISSAVAQDPHTVVLEFARAEFAPQDKLHFKILPQHLFSSPDVKRTDPFRTKPVGTGPFAVQSFNEDNSITLARHGAHWKPPALDEFVMREVSDKNYQAKLLVYESLEALVRVLPRDLAMLQNDRNVELYPYQTNSWWYFGFNAASGAPGSQPGKARATADPKVREALARMADVDALLAPIGTGDRVSGPFVPSSPFYNHDVAPIPHDPDRGAELLAEAGFTFNGTRWLGRDGRELKLKLVAPSNLETAQDVVINFQSQLQGRGIAIEPEFLGVAEWKERVWRDSAFDLVLSQWSFDRNEDIWEQFHSTGTRNFVHYANKDVDALLEQAREASDPQQKKMLLRQAHARIAADHPMIFLWTLDSYAALSTRVKNVVVHPFYFFTWAGDWTIGG